MEILSMEKLSRQKELMDEKNKNKQVIEKLDFLAQFDAEGSANFYKQRLEQVKERMGAQISEIKGINFEKAINQNMGYSIVERLLAQVPEAETLAGRISKRNTEALGKIIKHAAKHGSHLHEKENDFLKEYQAIIASMDEALANQEKIVAVLQELIEEDGEFRQEYLGRLNTETEKLDKMADETNLACLEKAEEMLACLPLANAYLEEVAALKGGLAEGMTENEKEPLVIDWEMMPAGTGPARDYQFNGQGDRERPKILKDRIDFIKSLNPVNVYVSRQPDVSREYEAYEFDNCVVICSPWSNHAVYVVSKENWQTASQLSKEEVRKNGGVRFKNIPGWQKRLEKIISGETDLFSLKQEKNGPERLTWGKDLESIRARVREVVFLNRPELKKAYDENDMAKAKEILKEIKFSHIQEMGISSAVPKFTLYRRLILECFPEADLKDEDFHISEKKYYWKNKSPEHMAENVRSAIFENFGDIKELIQAGDLEQAKIGLEMLTDNDFIDFGLRMVAKGKTGNSQFNSRLRALSATFPDICSAQPRKKYASQEERFGTWAEKLANAFMAENQHLESFVNQGEYEKLKIEIIKTIKSQGWMKFLVKHKLSGINGILGVSGGYRFWLKQAFPKIEWAK